MSVLYLIRHAQASFLAENYDKLSSRGECQAALLGEYWSVRKLLFDRACTGPGQRHRETAAFVQKSYVQKNLPFPTPPALLEFDEYQGEQVLRSALPALLDSDPAIRDLHSAFQSASDIPAQRHTFQKLFAEIIGKWMRGEISPANVEPWPDFCVRVNSGFAKFLSAGNSGERTAIFTSGGPIAIAMQRALNLSAEKTLQVSWMSRNCSWTEFLYSPDRFTLSSFNVHAHLDDPLMLTHR